MRSLKELAQVLDPETLRRTGSLRRLAISLTAKALWQLIGFRAPDGSKETMSVEPFTGIGIYARPPASSKSEAIVLMIGDAGTPVIVAARDEKTRAAIAGALLEDETATFNSQSIFVHKADGTMEARSAAGVAQSLATNAALTALKNAIVNWTPVANDGGAALKVALTALFTGPPVWPAGTTKLKGE